ncbi:carboxypeptidase [Cryptococcus deuterogattii 99/473]|uniref:Carboxypeptidase n=1 Tax=Cryptococcus deuterogattii Ram5 TaxID=1296110 RepID=A0A0D0V9Y7_9TREE|nr:carboxypeptidase [Cryptococcus deuterogattii Ram5]KIY56908.1 carboxypeptidase [Cryptococcus deuterogattii 99/473]
MWYKLISVALLALTTGSIIGHAPDFSALISRKPSALSAQKEAKRRLLGRGNLSHNQLFAKDPSEKKFYNNKTSEFFIQSLPDVPYDLGEIYSGLIPIDYNNQSEALFFVFQPKLGEPSEDITIWFNGGPGCSSLGGWLQENGRWTWQPGTLQPALNPYSWVNLTNMLWVEQPIGTGFSRGTPKSTTQEETAQDFIKWFKNFQDVFGISNYRIFVSGESYAGRYVPYIGAAMLDEQNTTYYNLSELGALLYDPVIGEFDVVQRQMTTYPLVEANANLFNFNATVMAELKQYHESCGFRDYIDKYLQFPPLEKQPPILYNKSDNTSLTCDLFNGAMFLEIQVNPCFNVYEINSMCPLLWDVLGMPTGFSYAPGPVYFNRSDVKAAMHAPQDVDWIKCSPDPVYVGGDAGPEWQGDLSADPIQNVLPQVIDATNRVLVSNGDYDMATITNGTLLAIQNMTWNGQLGFQAAPSEEVYIGIIDTQWSAIYEANGLPGFPGPQTTMGIQHYERGLMWVETFQAGHMQPQYQPRMTYRHLEWLLGLVDKI